MDPQISGSSVVNSSFNASMPTDADNWAGDLSANELDSSKFKVFSQFDALPVLWSNLGVSLLGEE